MESKICLVTGATEGIGKATAQALAKAGHHVLLPVRNEAKGQAVIDQIRQQVPSATVDLWQVDLSRQESIKQLARQLNAHYDHFDVLINTAGVVMGKRQLTADGLELTFATNHLAYFLLTNLLMPRLRASPHARIINTSADILNNPAHIHFDDLMLAKGYSGPKAYLQSKLANVLFTYALDRRLKTAGLTNITVNAFHPGIVRTNLARDTTSGPLNWLLRLARPFLMDPQKAAEAPVRLALDPELAQTSGRFFVKGQPVSTAKNAESTNERIAEQLWHISEQLTHLPFQLMPQ